MNLTPLVEYLVRSIAGDPESVRVSERRERAFTAYHVELAQEDVGRVIGKGGRVIGCIRSVVGVAAEAAGDRAMVKIITD